MPTETPLIPCINRNLSHVLDVSDLGLFAYGARNSIYIFNFTGTIPVILDSKFIHDAHKGKIISLSFCKIIDQKIASLGEDSLIKIWDLETQDCIASLEVKEGVRVIEWLHGSSTSVCYPGVMGSVGKWNYVTSNNSVVKTGSESPVRVLSSNKMSSEFLAAGHEIGTISVLNINNQSLLYKLKCHSAEITSLCWSMVSPSMLLSTSMDHTSRMWKMGECKPIRTFNFPKPRKMDGMKDGKFPSRYCGLFHPEKSDAIICSNVRGFLGEVIFKEGEDPKFDSYDFSSNIANFRSANVMLPFQTEENKGLFLVSDHLKISLWDAYQRKLLSTFFYMNGNIYDLTASPHNSYHVAIGAADGCLRVWNLSETSKIDMTSVMLYARMKVMSIAWHPTIDGIIAYGSDEGRIGIADIQKKRNLYTYETHHSNAVYAMQWAPCFKIKDSDQDLFLYSCGGGVIYIHELGKQKEKPVDFDDLITYPPDLEYIKSTHSELRWKSDHTCLIVGSFKGFLDLFDSKFNFLTRVTLQMKVVESVKWHPHYTFTSSNESNYSAWFAAAGNEDNILVFDTSDLKSNESEASFCRPARTLIGHKKKISSLCWSPHCDGHLASASRDGTVLVWNVITSTIIANYPWHKELVYAVHWSYFDPDTIYSGGMDCCLRVWKISEQINSAPEKCQIYKRKQMRKSNKKSEEPNKRTEVSTKEEEKVSETDMTCLESHSNNSINASAEGVKMTNIEEDPTNEDSRDKNYRTKSYVKEHFPKQRNIFSGALAGSKEKKLKNVLKLADLLCQSVDSSDPENMILISDLVTDEESLHFGFFCDQSTALKMLETKAERERNYAINEKYAYYQLIANNVERLLIDAAENKKLTDFLMSAATTVSRKFYNEMCQKYAEQLIEEKNFTKAAMYLTFCGELHNAVKILLEKASFLEALALAKARFPADDPFIHGILQKASNHFSVHHELETEAECHLAMREPADAAKSLYRIGDSSSIYASSYMCYKFNLIEQAESYGYMCMEKCLAEAAWPTFYKLIDFIDSLKVYKLLVRVHELIFTEMKVLKNDDIFANKLFGVIGNELPIWKSKAFGNSSISFLPFVYDDLKSNNIIPEDKDSLEKICDALDSFSAQRQKHDAPEEAHINIAIHISQAIVSALLNDLNNVQKQILKVFPTAYNIAFLPRISLWLILPFDVYWCSSKDAFISENKYLESQLLPFPLLPDIYKSWCKKVSEINTSHVEGFSICPVLSSNLNELVEQVSDNLSKKTCEDSLILYLSACLIDELRRVAKHGWKFRCYTNSQPEPKKIIHKDGNSNVVCNVKSGEKNIYNMEKDVKEQNNELEIDCNENTSQNITSNILVEKDVAIQGEVINPLSSEGKESGPFNNCESISMAENKLTVSSSSKLLVVGENDTTAVNTKTSNFLDRLQNFLFVSNNGTNTENNLIEDSNGTLEVENINNKDIISKIKFEVSELEKIENGISQTKSNGDDAGRDAFLLNGKIEEKNINFECINDKTKETENQSSTELTKQVEDVAQHVEFAEDDHLQCWSDVSLFYTLAKIFISVNCKDEYALFYYLQKYLHYLGNEIADKIRQKSVKSALNNSKKLLNTAESKVQLDKNLIETEKNLENCIVSCTLKNVETPKEVSPENLLPIVGNKSPSNKNNICRDLIETDKNHQENVISCSSKTIDLLDTKEYNSNPSCDDNSFTLEKEMKKEVDEVQIENDLAVNNDEKDELIIETIINTPNVINEGDFNSTLHKKVDLNQEQTVIEKLHLKQEEVAQLLKFLNLVELDYPDPFIAVDAINAVCSDIFRKNPCSFVKNKFHEFAHEINKWNAKFYVPDKILKCDICKETISV